MILDGFLYVSHRRNSILFQDDKHAKRQEESENIDDRKAILPHWLLNPEETNTQKEVAEGGVVAAAEGDATTLRVVVPTTTPVDAARTG